jgi:hypothetical protein
MTRAAKTVAALVAATAVCPGAASLTEQDTPSRRESMAYICRAFVEWQAIMIADGRPRSDYAGTGIRLFCPGMV